MEAIVNGFKDMLATLDGKTGERGAFKSDAVTDFAFVSDVAIAWLL